MSSSPIRKSDRAKKSIYKSCDIDQIITENLDPGIIIAYNKMSLIKDKDKDNSLNKNEGDKNEDQMITVDDSASEKLEKEEKEKEEKKTKTETQKEDEEEAKNKTKETSTKKTTTSPSNKKRAKLESDSDYEETEKKQRTTKSKEKRKAKRKEKEKEKQKEKEKGNGNGKGRVFEELKVEKSSLLQSKFSCDLSYLNDFNVSKTYGFLVYNLSFSVRFLYTIFPLILILDGIKKYNVEDIQALVDLFNNTVDFLYGLPKAANWLNDRNHIRVDFKHNLLGHIMAYKALYEMKTFKDPSLNFAFVGYLFKEFPQKKVYGNTFKIMADTFNSYFNKIAMIQPNPTTNDYIDKYIQEHKSYDSSPKTTNQIQIENPPPIQDSNSNRLNKSVMQVDYQPEMDNPILIFKNIMEGSEQLTT